MFEALFHILKDPVTGAAGGDRLRRAVERGIITAAQYEAILALDGPSRAAPHEAPRGLNWVSVSYSLGALLVLAAFGWFLADRWDELGPGGVLAVSLLYAAIFAGAGVYLRREGFRTAGGIATTLAVTMTPIVTWAFMAVFGGWSAVSRSEHFLFHGEARESARWVVVELATIAVAAATLRRVRFPLLVGTMVISALWLAHHASHLIFGAVLQNVVEEYLALIVGTALLAAGYFADRRDDAREDYAGWLYPFGLLAVAFGYLEMDGHRELRRHVLPVIGLLLITASLYLRRRVFLIFGSLALLGYLAYLAFDVFRGMVGFPLVLAAFGAAVIALTVRLQRRYPVLVERIRASNPDGKPRLPGGYATALAPVALSIILFAAAYPGAVRRFDQYLARERREAERDRRETEQMRRDAEQRRQERLRADSVAGARAAESAAVRQP